MKEFYLLNLFRVSVILSMEKREISLFKPLNILFLPSIKLTTSTLQKAIISIKFMEIIRVYFENH
jgi:hypothetical protein